MTTEIRQRLTRQQAINAKCKDCNYDPLDNGSWLAQVESCTDTECPLYEYRPLTRATQKELKFAKFSAMTPEERARYRVKQESTKRLLHNSKKQLRNTIRGHSDE